MVGGRTELPVTLTVSIVTALKTRGALASAAMPASSVPLSGRARLEPSTTLQVTPSVDVNAV